MIVLLGVRLPVKACLLNQSIVIIACTVTELIEVVIDIHMAFDTKHGFIVLHEHRLLRQI